MDHNPFADPSAGGNNPFDDPTVVAVADSEYVANRTLFDCWRRVEAVERGLEEK